MSKKAEKSTCPICGKKFVKKVLNQKYCSTKCKRQAAKKCSTENKNVAKKLVAKKIAEKVKLPKLPVKKPDVVISVHGIDPYKKFALALCIAIHEFKKILTANTMIPVKKGK